MKRIKSIFFFFNFKIGAFLEKKRLKLHKCKKKSGSVQIWSSEFLYPLYNHPLDVIVCCTSEGQNIFWFTFTHLNNASFLLKMIFFLLSKMLKTCWRFFGKDWKKRFQKTKWFPHIWFTDANWCYKIKFTRHKMYNLVKKSTYLPSARILVLFVWTINHRIEFKASPGQAFLLNKLLTIKTHLKFELIFAI